MRIARNFRTITAFAAVAIAISATAFASLPQHRERTSSVTPTKRPLMAAIKDGFSYLLASVVPDTSTAPRAQACDDFKAAFLSPACAKARPKHARRSHRVATFVMGRRNVSANDRASDGATARKID
jgi:hypothetical protein